MKVLFKNKNKNDNLKIELIPKKYSSINDNLDYFGTCLVPNISNDCPQCLDNQNSLEYIWLDDDSTFDVYINNMSKPLHVNITAQEFYDLYKNDSTKLTLSLPKTLSLEIIQDIFSGREVKHEQ